MTKIETLEIREEIEIERASKRGGQQCFYLESAIWRELARDWSAIWTTMIWTRIRMIDMITINLNKKLQRKINSYGMQDNFIKFMTSNANSI